MMNNISQNMDSLFSTAQQSLLVPHSIETRHIEQVFASMMAHRLDYADLYFQYSRAESWSLEEGIVKSGSFNIDQGVGVSAVSGEKTAFASSAALRLPALARAARGAGAEGGGGRDARLRLSRRHQPDRAGRRGAGDARDRQAGRRTDRAGIAS